MTFVADENAPGFANAKTLLTNGRDDSIGYLLGFAPRSPLASVSEVPESGAFATLAGLDLPGPDLAGFDITAITLTVVDLYESLFFSFASATGGIRIDFIGDPVPEPATALLFGCGLAGLVMLGGRTRTAPR